MRSSIALIAASFSLVALTAATCDPPTPPAVVCVKPTDVETSLQKMIADNLRQCQKTGVDTFTCKVLRYWDLDRRKMRETCK